MFLTRWLRAPKTSRRPARPLFRPLVESLEDRAVPAAGALDPTFGSGGKVLTDFLGSGPDVGQAVAIQLDGKIVVVGVSEQPGSEDDFALARYNLDGSLDTSFGNGGRVTTDFGLQLWDVAACVALQSDGKIVVAGSARLLGVGDDFALARYHADGSLDTSFGNGGKVTTSFQSTGTGANEIAYGLVIQSDGKIVAAGTSGSRFAVARYHANGSLDASFDADGKATIRFATNSSDIARGVALQSDGKIVVAGTSRRVVNSGYDFALARFNVNGSLDKSFDKDGKVTTDFSRGEDQAYAIALQSDGKIVAAGYATTTTDRDFALARYNANGSLDASFGSGGTVTTHFGVSSKHDEIRGIAIQGDGKIVAAGRMSIWVGNPAANDDTALARYNANGSLDAGFGAGGKVIADLGNSDAANGVALQSDGKIVVAGYSRLVGTATSDVLVARFLVSAPLMAASSLEGNTVPVLTPTDVTPLMVEAIARWQAPGVDTSALHAIDIRIADLGGTTLGLASGSTIWLDDNAAGWGWFVDPTPADDSEFITPGDQGEQIRVDLLTVLAHEIGHLLGYEHDDNAVMSNTLAAGVRYTPGHDAIDGLLPLSAADDSHSAPVFPGTGARRTVR